MNKEIIVPIEPLPISSPLIVAEEQILAEMRNITQIQVKTQEAEVVKND